MKNKYPCYTVLSCLKLAIRAMNSQPGFKTELGCWPNSYQLLAFLDKCVAEAEENPAYKALEDAFYAECERIDDLEE